MIQPFGNAGTRPPHRSGVIWAAAAVSLMLLFTPAAAQEGSVPSPQPPAATPETAPPQQAVPATQEQAPPPQAAPARPDAAAPPTSGLIDAVGRLIEGGVTSARDVIGGIGSQADSVARGAAAAAGSVAKGAAEAVSNVGRLPTSLIARGREQCPIARNGAPDCRTAAEALCRANGFASGSSIDFQSNENCPPAVVASGERPPPGACVLEHFVTRALCQGHESQK